MADDNAVIQQMRDQIKTLNARVKELEPYEAEATQYRRTSALRDAGFDPDSGPAKALLKLHEGDMTAEALKETAQTYGLPIGSDTSSDGTDSLPTETTDRMTAQAAMNEAFTQAEPGRPTMSYADWQKVRGDNPREAGRLLSTGQVDLPDYVARQLEDNRTSTPLGR